MVSITMSEGFYLSNDKTNIPVSKGVSGARGRSCGAEGESVDRSKKFNG